MLKKHVVIDSTKKQTAVLSIRLRVGIDASAVSITTDMERPIVDIVFII